MRGGAGAEVLSGFRAGGAEVGQVKQVAGAQVRTGSQMHRNSRGGAQACGVVEVQRRCTGAYVPMCRVGAALVWCKVNAEQEVQRWWWKGDAVLQVQQMQESRWQVQRRCRWQVQRWWCR